MADSRILSAAFVSGGCAMVVELAGSRVIAPYLGSTIYTWASVIGLVLAALSLGYYIGGKFADKYKDRRHLSYIFMSAAFCTLAVPFFMVFLGPFLTFIDHALASLIASITLVPASLFYGMVGPYAIKLTMKKGEEGKGSGRVFAISTVGSIIGVLGTGFLLIPNLALTHIFFLAALSMLICSIIIGDALKLPDMIVFLMFGVFLFQISFSPLVLGDLIYSTSSEYYEISVFNITENGTSSLVLYLNTYPSSAMLENGSLNFDYVIKARLGYELVEDPDRGLVIGVAGGTQIEDLKDQYPNIHVDGVEIDEKTIEVGERFFNLEIDERTDIIIDDARRYLKTTNRTYDIVLMDVFKGTSIPYHLASVEFFRELKEDMGPDSVLIINLISSVEGEDAMLLNLFYNTLSSEFSEVLILPMYDDPTIIQSCIIIAGDIDMTDFKEKYSEDIYPFQPITDRIITDELNPVDTYVLD
jgi:spermidine synthase